MNFKWIPWTPEQKREMGLPQERKPSFVFEYLMKDVAGNDVEVLDFEYQ